MKRPIRTTLVYGLICALTIVPTAGLLSAYIGGSLAFKLMLWTALCGYAVLLSRWSAKGLGNLLLPLTLLLGIALWPGMHAAFFFLALGMLCWLRSGICFSRFPIRAVAAETTTVAGGAGLILLLDPASAVAWSVSIWLFFLMQALYFFIVPVAENDPAASCSQDPFEQAHREARRILETVG